MLKIILKKSSGKDKKNCSDRDAAELRRKEKSDGK